MLWTIFVILLILWLLGLVSGYTLGGFIHLLLLLAIVTMLIRTGKGPFPGCGGVSLMTVVLERQRDTWKRIAYIESLET